MLKGFVSDYAANESKLERLAFGRCIEYGAYTELKSAGNVAARLMAKTGVAQKIHTNTGLDISICNGALDALEAALFGVATPMPPPQQAQQNQDRMTQHQQARQYQQQWQQQQNYSPPPRYAASPTHGNKTNRNVLIAVAAVVVVVIGIIIAIQNTPESAEAHYAKAARLSDAGDYDGAIRECTAAIRLDPNYEDAYILRGATYLTELNFSRAIQDFEKALSLDPTLQEVKQWLEVARQATGWW
jgi:tetratricopeptide (TPR) repeat protein